MLNLDKLEIGQMFPSMKELFRFVGFTGLYDGDSRLAKEKILRHYISWEKIPGTRNIVITEIKKTLIVITED